MARFYLPYNFIPATGKVGGHESERYRYDFNPKPNDPPPQPDGLAALARHDLWQTGRRHGRIICHIKLLTETVVGNEHTDTTPAAVLPYRVNEHYALPANSLRGMVASVMETLSQSALRVLQRHRYPDDDKLGARIDIWPAFQEIDHDLVPWNPERDALTPAEAMLGAAEDLTGTDENFADNLASRVRFHDAVLSTVQPVHGVLADSSFELKELGQPRPTEIPANEKTGKLHNGAAPTTYFYDPGSDEGIPKQDLSERVPHQPSQTVPNGRKAYLSHSADGVSTTRVKHVPKRGRENQPCNMCMKVRPLNRGTEFVFHIDFDNLDDAELTLLRTALVPDRFFLHRLGLGKSLGLGQIKLSLAGQFLREPEQRYGLEALTAASYQSRADCSDDLRGHWTALPRYASEAAALADPGCPESPLQADERLIDNYSRDLLNKVGVLSDDNLQPDVDIRWRQNYGNHKEPAGQLPAMAPDRPLPTYDEAIEAGGDGDSLRYADHAAAKWLRTNLADIAGQHTSFEDTERGRINGALTGKALFKRWNKLSGDSREQTRDFLLSVIDERDLVLDPGRRDKYTA